MAKSNALIIFIKNPVLGKVKTRLAEGIGDKNALKVYHHLLKRTREITKELDDTERFVFYSDYLPTKDEWSEDYFEKMLQKGNNLGEKITHAFKQVFREDFEKVMLIHPDCPKLTHPVIEKAFRELDEHDVALGPTEDGGYYGIAIKKPMPFLFDREYSTGKVFNDTMKDLEEKGLSAFVLPKYKDVDRPDDLGDLASLLVEKGHVDSEEEILSMLDSNDIPPPATEDE